MPVTFLAFSGVMTRAAMKLELDRARNWLNDGLVATDIADGSVESVHIYKQEIYASPVNTFRGVFGDLYFRREGTFERAGPLRGSQRVSVPSPPGSGIIYNVNEDAVWERRVERESIFVSSLRRGGLFVVPGTMTPVQVEATSDVEAVFQFSASNIYDNTLAGAPTYPDRAGRFVIAYRNRATGVETRVMESVRDVPARFIDTAQLGTRSTIAVHETFSFDELEPGLYDYYLLFDLGAGSEAVTQHVVSGRNIVIEVFKK